MTKTVNVNLLLWEQVLLVVGIAISKDPEIISEIINIKDLHDVMLKEHPK